MERRGTHLFLRQDVQSAHPSAAILLQGSCADMGPSEAERVWAELDQKRSGGCDPVVLIFERVGLYGWYEKYDCTVVVYVRPVHPFVDL